MLFDTEKHYNHESNFCSLDFIILSYLFFYKKKFFFPLHPTLPCKMIKTFLRRSDHNPQPSFNLLCPDSAGLKAFLALTYSLLLWMNDNLGIVMKRAGILPENGSLKHGNELHFVHVFIFSDTCAETVKHQNYQCR